MLTSFNPYPFERLNLLIKDIKPNTPKITNLTIGEPQFQTPQVIQNALKDSVSLLNKYPKSKGEDFLIEAQLDFIAHRFGVQLSSAEIIPTFGTREVLFNFPQFLLHGKETPTIAYPSPFYQIYEGGAIASGATAILMPLTAENHFKPSLTQEDLQRVHLVILNSPNNPTGSVLGIDELQQWVEYALKYDFVVLNDECYSEIYQHTPPPSILEASKLAKNDTFKNVLALNSISKRSSAPGLRSGFIAGDREILKFYRQYRTYLGCALPLPLQHASAKAWQTSGEEIRKCYARNLEIAQELFSEIVISPYTFYLWLKVKDDLAITKKLYQEAGILVLPGRFLGKNGEGFIRVALVYPDDIMLPALKTLKTFLDQEI
ncbi:hypothetical protein BBW65_06620 [Helicobacter enhydrae]|uniref:Aminotransferase class I/classII large domain-containing protein n=1 Tax=Helicobacter enhydrae TaxID=222136 RepID=A0A1B1U6W9_9HELI|nr:succinyldiaminopimelate transaminase [Helicobacter enhydrae]ANV98490.1 hypothetical protein BBW65_06620 [Helicobacter enhydrae]